MSWVLEGKLEQYLAAFHDSNPGITSRAFAGLPVVNAGRRFGSSYECLANEVLETDGPHALLDLACGDGLLLAILAARNQSELSLFGVDLSKGELDAARCLLGNRATLRQGRAHSLPIASASLDHVVCHMALMLMEDVEVVLTEVHRVLKKGAAFSAIVGATPSRSKIFDLYVSALSQYPRKEEFSGIRFGDRRLQTPEGITQLLSNGFEAVAVQDVMIPRRCSPRELCAWFEDTYDFHMLDERCQGELTAGFMAAIEEQCGSDRKVEYNDRLYLISAAAA